MKKFALRITMLLMAAQQVQTTVVFSVGTKDGIAVCEDRQLTTRTEAGVVFSKDYFAKVQKLGDYGLFTTSSDLRRQTITTDPVMGYHTITTDYDILPAINSFFALHDIRNFDALMEEEFEYTIRLTRQQHRAPLTSLFSSNSLGQQGSFTEIVFYWIDTNNRQNIYGVDIFDSIVPTLPPSIFSGYRREAHPTGRSISLSNFATTNPWVTGGGAAGYVKLAADSEVEFDSLDRNPRLAPFLSSYLPAESVDPIFAARALKELIEEISAMDEYDVSKESDCYLFAADKVKDLNEMILEDDTRIKAEMEKEAPGQGVKKPPTKKRHP